MKKKINKSTMITLAICLVAIGVALYFFVFRKKSSTQSSTTTLPSVSGSTTTTPSTPSAKYTDDSFPLKLNSGGAKVKYLQSALNAKFGTSLDVDGKFGPKTEAACMAYLYTPAVDESRFKTLVP